MKRTRFLLLPALALLLLIGLLGLGSQRLGLVHASGTTVQVTNCHDSGPGSLRDALASAASGSIITFGLSCDTQLNSTLIISKTLTLSGEGQQVTLDGQHAVQVLSVGGGVTLTLKTLTIANGSSGGGINNDGTLHLSNSRVIGNSGDGIDNGGTLHLSNSRVIGNSGDGISNSGNGIVSISNSTISGNSEGIFNFDPGGVPVMSISNSTVIGNSGDGIDNYTEAGSSRSGIRNFNGRMPLTNSIGCNASYDTFSTICISNTMISGNGSDGIYNFNGTVRISNSTVSGNSAGGIDNDSDVLNTIVSISHSTVAANSYGIYNISTVNITNSTVSDNSSDGIANAWRLNITNSTVSGNSGYGIYNLYHAVLRGNIVANNMGGNCGENGRAPSDQGDNLSSDSSCHFTASTSLQNTDPKLDPAGLQNNGGPTQTIALQPDSPAVDQIPVGSNCPATDQRVVARPQGPNCDSGAFEMTAADGLTVMIHVVKSFHLAKSLQTSLDQQVQTVLADLRAQHTAQACQDLTSFINSVQAQSGSGLTTTQATQLLKEAAVIHTRLGC